MPTHDILIEPIISNSIRARQVCCMYDCPPDKKQRIEYHVNMPLDENKWNVGIIVGPSGSGKSTIAKKLWPSQIKQCLEWSKESVIDSFPANMKVSQIAEMLGSVGFNTIPAWLRPYEVLSNGEKFRCDVAMRLLSDADPIVIDEFSSVVDRQVAQIASHAVQKTIRKYDKKLIVVTCHYDVIDWLQPEWVYDTGNQVFSWRSLRRRPGLRGEIARVSYDAWSTFAPYHYMTAELQRSCTCFVLWCNDKIAAFAGVGHFPHARVGNIKRVSRLVTLPDYQGIGLAFVLVNTLGAAYRAIGYRLRTYPAHPSLIRSFQRASNWLQTKKEGTLQNVPGVSCSRPHNNKQRMCAVFEYVGDAMNREDAQNLIDNKNGSSRTKTNADQDAAA